ncbi:MAG: N-acetyltransferase [Bacteroidetes bacterium]|nr:MAG: N-acetyltransferase [Bacteroidota bacterium]
MKKILESQKLFLREFNLDDCQFVIELLNTEGWLKYIGNRNVQNEAQAKVYLENGSLKSYKENGFGLYLVALKTQEPIGMCGFVKRENVEDVEIGFAFLPAYQKKGYAFEIVSETMKYGFETLKLPKITAVALANNTNSIKLLEKLGLIYERKFQKENQDLLLFVKNVN